MWIHPCLRLCSPFLQRTDNWVFWSRRKALRFETRRHRVTSLANSFLLNIVLLLTTFTYKAHYRDCILPPAWSILFKTWTVFWREPWEIVSCPLTFSPTYFYLYKQPNSTWDNQIKSELKVQTSNNSQSVVCVSVKPQRALINEPVQSLAWLINLISSPWANRISNAIYPQSSQQRGGKEISCWCLHEF